MAFWVLAVLTAAVAFGVYVWTSNPGHQTQAMSAYIGTVALVLALVPVVWKPVTEFMDGFGS